MTQIALIINALRMYSNRNVGYYHSKHEENDICKYSWSMELYNKDEIAFLKFMTINDYFIN